MNENTIVCHATSVHHRYDTRILLKECMSLRKYFNNVYLIVADGHGDEKWNNINIIDAGKKNRYKFFRFISTSYKVFRKIRALNPSIVHFHDPEMFPYALVLRKKFTVVYDAHEDFPKQLLGKDYLPKYLKSPISTFFSWLELYVSRKISGVIVALPFLKNRYEKLSIFCENINNFPLIEELSSKASVPNERERAICFIGSITSIRGLDYLVQALEFCKVKLYLAGTFGSTKFREKLASMEGWKYVVELGQISRSEAAHLLSKASIGIVTFLNLPNHYEAQPNKLFEYMSAGVPVIASNFPLWKRIVEDNQCGICVDPTSPSKLANAINYILEHPEIAKKMGQNGVRNVLEKYNWEAEEVKLLDFYKKLS